MFVNYLSFIYMFKKDLAFNNPWLVYHKTEINQIIYIQYIYYIITMLVVTKSLCGFMSNQVQYEMKSAQYLL